MSQTPIVTTSSSGLLLGKGKRPVFSAVKRSTTEDFETATATLASRSDSPIAFKGTVSAQKKTSNGERYGKPSLSDAETDAASSF